MLFRSMKYIDFANILPLVLLFITAINFIIAILFSRTSVEKGYYGIVTGILTMTLGFVGMLYAIALKENEAPAENIDKRYIKSTIALLLVFVIEILLIVLGYNFLF